MSSVQFSKKCSSLVAGHYCGGSGSGGSSKGFFDSAGWDGPWKMSSKKKF